MRATPADTAGDGSTSAYRRSGPDGPAVAASRLIQRSDGYIETLVLGQTIVGDGELTDNRPGDLVRGSRPMTTA
jgi:hypothetical protein